MASEYMMALGDLRFSVDTATYDRLTRSSRWRWNALPRLARVDAMQMTGREAEHIDIDGVVYPHYKGSLAVFETMRAAGNAGEPLTLSDGTGTVHGRWVIEQMEETRKTFFADGRPRKIEFRLGLAEYGDDA